MGFALIRCSLPDGATLIRPTNDCKRSGRIWRLSLYPAFCVMGSTKTSLFSAKQIYPSAFCAELSTRG
ncbi:hypothetical protein CIT292_10200 [Citrobacter youngae ATCC 29220]|uniref:Uncharacterized protein n=1 Tax=Citrobacter youngae ATCC 29220 TaxID=500640 RepID=D4BI36_9ENTR|nr:hypothetical protein CIT292_10200 [Citrobacter youngae ATCC 29220]